MKLAICTMVVGKRYEDLFRDYVVKTWQDYCHSCHYELIIFQKPFMRLPGKSIAWQKLLILRQPELQDFDKILWLDSDIIIKQGAPPIEVPSGSIGYVPEASFTGSISSWYDLFSLPSSSEIVQTGVLCLEKRHDSILQSALSLPETNMYEMPALSWKISESGLGFRLDKRFNALLGTLMLNYAPRWIVTTKLLKEFLWVLYYPPLRRAVRDVCEENWFIHAAGAKRDLIKVSKYLRSMPQQPLQVASRKMPLAS